MKAHRRRPAFAVRAKVARDQSERLINRPRAPFRDLLQEPFRPGLARIVDLPVRDHVPAAGDRMNEGFAWARVQGPTFTVYAHADQCARSVRIALHEPQGEVEMTSRGRGA